LSVREVALLVSLYPGVWGVAQLATGALSDRWGRRGVIVAGMAIQGAALVAIALSHGMVPWAIELAVLGLGTALVYPALLASVGDISHPSWRSSAIGVYRLWRDLGYVGGALLAGILADRLGVRASVMTVGWITAASGAAFALGFNGRRLQEASR
jgi:MFS family permease